VPIGAAAIRFVLRHPAVTAIVVGARDAAEVNEDVSYLTAAVPAELFDELAAEQLIPMAVDLPLSPAHHHPGPRRPDGQPGHADRPGSQVESHDPLGTPS
jgi:hypothetical protein